LNAKGKSSVLGPGFELGPIKIKTSKAVIQ